MALRIIDCKATASSVTVFYSDAVDENKAKDKENYQIECPIGRRLSLQDASISYDQLRKAAFISLTSPLLPPGTWLSAVVSGVTTVSNVEFEPGAGHNTFATQVNGAGRTVTDVEDAGRGGRSSLATGGSGIGEIEEAIEDVVAYPILTEEIGYPPSPLARRTSAGSATPGMGALGQTATKALSDVLGWQPKDDPKAFIGALNASFALNTVDGHTEATWTPRTYAVQTDLAGGITGAQASVYTRAKDALDQSLTFLDGLYPLFKEAADEDVAALRATVRSQFTDVVNELGMLGGPRVSRVTQLFFLLLGQQLPTDPSKASGFSIETDPDFVTGSLGNLRTEFGFGTKDDLVNTVEDEQDVTNFRIVSDYVTSLAQSWLNNLRFFALDSNATPFFGTQLVLLSRQLSVVAEAVNEVRFTLDSVFVGPAERQTLQIDFQTGDPSIFLEDLFTWIDTFTSDEGPRLIQDGGKFAVGESFVPIATQLQTLVQGALVVSQQKNGGQVPPGYRTVRVQRSLQQLSEALQQLVNRAAPISHVIRPEPEPDLNVLAANPSSGDPASGFVTIIGTGFDTDATVTFIQGQATISPSTPPPKVLSDHLIFVSYAASDKFSPGLWDIEVSQNFVNSKPTEKATLARAYTVIAKST